MSILIQPKRWTVKPPLGAQIQRGHSLARGLTLDLELNEGGGRTLVDSVHNIQLAGAGNVVWSATEKGISWVNSFADTYTSLASRSWIDDLPQISVELMYKPSNPGYGNPFYKNGYWYVSAGGVFNFFRYTGSTNLSVTAATVPVADVWYHLVVTHDGSLASSGVKFYINGVLDGTSTATSGTGAFQSDAGQLLSIFGDAGGGILGNVIRTRLWNRELTANEAQQLYIDPYCFIQSQSPERRLWAAAAAPGGFQPAWAMASNRVIGAGTYVP